MNLPPKRRPSHKGGLLKSGRESLRFKKDIGRKLEVKCSAFIALFSALPRCLALAATCLGGKS